MPRRAALQPVAPALPLPNSLIASAVRFDQEMLSPFRRSPSVRAWQTEAWTMYDSVGELRAGANWIGNAMSRIKLVIKQKTPNGVATLDDGPAVDALDAFFDGESGQSQMLATLGIHLTVPGESYIIGEPTEKGPDTWIVASTEEVSNPPSSDIWTINRGDGKRNLATDSLIMRVWRPHPRQWIEADSSVRAVLPILRELITLTKHVAASADSRLAGAGLLILPQEMTFASPPTDDEIPADPRSDPFFDALVEAMTVPIQNRESAAAVVPLVVRAPGEYVGSVQHITFSTPFDAQAQSLREEGIKRVALGMDLPPEIMLGTGSANHWSAWQIDESALKIHIEPACELICDALTRKWLWPVLESTGNVDYDTVVGWDTSDLRIRPNHATEAIELYDRGQLSPDALRRETGFDESDAPTIEERREILLLKLVGSNNDLTGAAAAALGIPLQPADVGNRFQPVSPPQVEAPTGRDRNLPVEEQSRAAAARLAAVEVVVLRALERANNRVNRRGRQPHTCLASECDAALQGAWSYVPKLAYALEVPTEWLTDQLDSYARSVLTGEFEHCPEALRDYLFDVKNLTHA